jgi:hypothetical protein
MKFGIFLSSTGSIARASTPVPRLLPSYRISTICLHDNAHALYLADRTLQPPHMLANESPCATAVFIARSTLRSHGVYSLRANCLRCTFSRHLLQCVACCMQPRYQGRAALRDLRRVTLGLLWLAGKGGGGALFKLKFLRGRGLLPTESGEERGSAGEAGPEAGLEGA